MNTPFLEYSISFFQDLKIVITLKFLYSTYSRNYIKLTPYSRNLLFRRDSKYLEAVIKRRGMPKLPLLSSKNYSTARAAAFTNSTVWSTVTFL